MSIELVLLAAALWALVFVPAGYFIRVWLERTTEIPGRSPCVDELYTAIDAHQMDLDAIRTRVVQMSDAFQLVESKLTLMSNEMADFFDKTRKSEERQRGLTRRAEAAIGDEEDTSESDQRLLELMEERTAEEPLMVSGAYGSREAYYASERKRLGM